MMTRPQSRRSRAALAWAAILFVMAFGVGELTIRRSELDFADPFYAVRRDRVHARIMQLRTEHGTRPKLVVALGSSRVYNGLDGKLIEEQLRQSLGPNVCFASFATHATGPHHSLAIYERLIHDGLTPDEVWVETLPSFCDARRRHDNLFMPGLISILPEDCRRLNAHGIPVSVVPSKISLSAIAAYRSELRRRYLPLINTAREVSALQQFSEICDPWGNGLVDVVLPEAIREHQIRKSKEEYGEIYQSAEWGDLSLDVLGKLLADCHARGISTTVMLMPEGPTARSWYRPGALAQLRQKVNRLAWQHESRVVLGSDWIDEEGFADSTHLLAVGARQFSERLSREILTIKNDENLSVADREQGAIRR